MQSFGHKQRSLFGILQVALELLRDELSNEWFLFDDSRVSKVKSTEVVSSAGYMLFYKRRE